MEGNQTLNNDFKKRKVKRTRKMGLEERVNSEFKHLRLRIRRLEEIVLSQKNDSGSILEPAHDLKKG